MVVLTHQPRDVPIHVGTGEEEEKSNRWTCDAANQQREDRAIKNP